MLDGCRLSVWQIFSKFMAWNFLRHMDYGMLCIFNFLNDDNDDVAIAAVVYGWVRFGYSVRFGHSLWLASDNVCGLWIFCININCTVCIDCMHYALYILYTLCTLFFVQCSFMEFSTIGENKLINWLDLNCADDWFKKKMPKVKNLNKCCSLHANAEL